MGHFSVKISAIPGQVSVEINSFRLATSKKAQRRSLHVAPAKASTEGGPDPKS